eukprot:PLAT4736.1.p2 GENE.PLAT4736.1~~PLAT4736.1.p2  ORF type:complete len:707 (+),score=374.04 PLAT4736.1:166-2286(+)
MKREREEESKDVPLKRAKAAVPEIEKKVINTIRVLAADVVEKAKSGHPGAPMGCAPMAHVLWGHAMRYSAADPTWYNRDRFVLSNGHACALQYTMLHMAGYDVTMDDLKSFRQLESKTPGHPESFATPGIEVCTGPLGQGICNAVGMAIGQAHMAATFNKPEFPLVDHFVYAICGDGCLQEGVSGEASSLAGHLKLSKLIVLYDDNKITIDGDTSLSFTEDVRQRYLAYGWDVLTVEDGDNDSSGILQAIRIAQKSPLPTLIRVRTTIGIGSGKAGTHGVHGAPLGGDDLAAVKTHYGFDPEVSFNVEDDVAAWFADRSARADASGAWKALLERYSDAHPEAAAEFKRRIAGELPAGWREALPTWSPEDKAVATRATSGKVLNALAAVIPEMVGGSADLTPSNKTALACTHDFQPDTPDGRYLRFGVREHGMAAICNGLSAYGGILPFGATFLNFVGYALGAMRLSALAKHQVIYIMTHDSIALGEDGPTHQPIETLVSLRGMPNMLVFRPADGNEVSGSYAAALAASDSPSTLALSRQGLPHLAGSSIDAVAKGAYVLQDIAAASAEEAKDGADDGAEVKPVIGFVATGSEVALAIEAAKTMGVAARIVSMPCMELFEKQERSYKEEVFTPGLPFVSVEAAAVTGWSRYAHYSIGMRSFGASGPIRDVLPHFGFTAEAVAAKAKKVLDHFGGEPAPALFSALEDI